MSEKIYWMVFVPTITIIAIAVWLYLEKFLWEKFMRFIVRHLEAAKRIILPEDEK